VVGVWILAAGGDGMRITSPIPPLAQLTNTEALGPVLYTRMSIFFEAPA